MERDVPLLIVALTIAVYWLRVGALVVRARRKQHHDVGVIPERASERALWLLLVPLIACWCALPWLAVTHDRGAFAVPAFARGPVAYEALRWAAALGALACLAATIQCWRRMGRDWRMDISDRNTSLITDGLFAKVRHPIYALQIALVAATAIVLPSPAMLGVAALHVILMNVKARSEEAHLARMHGDAYRRYTERTGRFVPRTATRDS
jgi:protein-S-isoprenylcysteine O-methyltransferase Ste14